MSPLNNSWSLHLSSWTEEVNCNVTYSPHSSMVHKTHIQSIVVNDRGMSTVLTSSVHSSEAAFLRRKIFVVGE